MTEIISSRVFNLAILAGAHGSNSSGLFDVPAGFTRLYVQRALFVNATTEAYAKVASVMVSQVLTEFGGVPAELQAGGYYTVDPTQRYEVIFGYFNGFDPASPADPAYDWAMAESAIAFTLAVGR